MDILQHGFGIVEFQNVIKIDQLYLQKYIQFLKEINPSPFEIIKENGKEYAVNKTGFKFNIEDLAMAPSRYNILFDDHNLHYKEFINIIDTALYECLVQYCKIFPDAAKTVWWKTQGHIAGYSEGQHIGPHSDSHIEFDFVNAPQNESPMYNTVSSGLYLNNCQDDSDIFSFSGGEMYFEQANFTFKPRAGSVIMYPSNYIGRHEVKPVTKGNRYVYLQFYSYGYSSGQNSGIHWLPNLKKEALGY